MIQCAINGARSADEHPAVPVTPAELAADALACMEAGAMSVHMHPRDAAGRETLGATAHDAAVLAVRTAAPRLQVSCSTQESIDLGGAATRVEAIRAWTEPPDVVSLNLTQDDVIALGQALLARGIGIEAGVFTLDSAEALLAAPWARQVERVLVEILDEEEDGRVAVALAQAIDERVAQLGRPRLWHGHARATWAVVDAGRAAGHDVRVGLEDTLIDRHGRPMMSNVQQILVLTG